MDIKSVLAIMGKKIRKLRRKKGFSQESFASEAGLDRAHYGLIERGQLNITMSSILKISKALNVHPIEIFPDAEQLTFFLSEDKKRAE